MTHPQCPAQQSPEHPKYILPPPPTILPCQHQASDVSHLWRGTDGLQGTDKTKTCKNRHSQVPTECSGQRTWLASVCSGLSKQRAPQMLPCHSRDALIPRKAPQQLTGREPALLSSPDLQGPFQYPRGKEHSSSPGHLAATTQCASCRGEAGGRAGREEGDLALAPSTNWRWAAGVAQVYPQAAPFSLRLKQQDQETLLPLLTQ